MRNWTDEQKEAIGSRGQNLLVSAGAGSGKTAVMIERICALLCEGADLREMLVCTFTKTAAADMKRKLAEALGGKNDPRLRAQLRLLASAEISTLHAWCAHLIRQWFFDTDIDPEFTVLEEGEERALVSAAADAAIEEAKASGDRAFAGLYAVFLKNRNHRRLREATLAVYDYARAQPEPLVWLGKSAQYSDEEYRAQLHAELNREGDALCAKAESLMPAMAQGGSPADRTALNALYACMKAGAPYDIPLSRAGKTPACADLHETLKALKASYTDLTKRRRKVDGMPDCGGSLPYCHALASLAARTDELYSAAKRARGKVDYADLEHGALRILRGEHGKEITGKYRHVFVDEYQDISPLQEEILSRFSCGMFYVGDVKQSIYGFRMCRPDFFRDKAEKYAGGAGKAVRLTANFRSGGEILSFVNEIFSATMTKDFGGADYKSAPFRAGKRLAGAVRARLVDVPEQEDAAVTGVYSVQNDRAQCSDPALDAETDAAIDEILRMLDGEIPDEQAGEDKTRPVRYGDVAVLVRSRGAFTDLLEKKLHALGIPVSAAASDTPADAFASVSQLLSLLSLADNARDDVSLAAVMLSPLFGNFTADELAQAAKLRAGTFYECVHAYAARGENETLRTKTADLLADLAKWRRTAAETTVADLAGEITAHYGCFSKCLLYGGAREAAALDAFIEHLAAAENDTLHDYLRYIASCGMPRLSVAGGGGAVRILTVHASKGLEFPCVVLPHLHKQFNLRDVRASVLCDENEGVVLRTFDFENRTVTENARFAAVARRMRRAVGEEELRILYVAMTRAQYRLSLIARKRKEDEESRSAENANAYLDWLYGFLERVADKTAGGTQVADETPEEEPPADENTVRALRERFAAEERAAERAKATLGVRKASVTGVAHANDDEQPAPALWGDDDRAAQKGTAYHKFMQWGDWRAADAYEKLCARFPDEGKLVDRDEICAAFANAARFTGAFPHAREKAFVYNVAAREIGMEGDGDVLVQGVIDLMVFRENGVEIVDYKTGGKDGLRNPAYAKQLRLYKRAVENTLHVKVVGMYLYAFSAREFIPIYDA